MYVPLAEGEDFCDPAAKCISVTRQQVIGLSRPHLEFLLRLTALDISVHGIDRQFLLAVEEGFQTDDFLIPQVVNSVGVLGRYMLLFEEDFLVDIVLGEDQLHFASWRHARAGTQVRQYASYRKQDDDSMRIRGQGQVLHAH